MQKFVSRPNNKLFLEFYLGILSAFAPFVMDLYLASLPELAQYFKADASNAQLSLASCVLGLGAGQLFIGFISDHTGRKKPILVSLAVYLVVTLMCLYSPSITWFIALRFIQGVAASGGVVISRSSVADCYTGTELARMYGVVGMINGIATVLAPVVGGFVAVAYGWKGAFWTLLTIGAVMLPYTVCFRESMAMERRTAVSPGTLLRTMASMLTKKDYIFPCLAYGMLMSMIIVTLSSVPFIMKTMGMDESDISVTLGVNAVFLAITALASSRMSDQRRVLRLSAAAIVVGVAVISSSLWFGWGYWSYETGVLIMYLGLGGLNTASVTLAMDAVRSNAGAASAVLGTIGYLFGGIATVLEGAADPMTSTPILFAVLAFITLVLCLAGTKVEVAHQQ